MKDITTLIDAPVTGAISGFKGCKAISTTTTTPATTTTTSDPNCPMVDTDIGPGGDFTWKNTDTWEECGKY